MQQWVWQLRGWSTGSEGRWSSLLGGVSFYANAWEQLPCRRDSFPALVSHSGQASLAKAFFSPSPASPPSLPNAEGWDVHLLSPWQDEAGFSGNCVKATKPPYILKKTPKQPNKKTSTIFSYSFFLSMMETGGQTGSSALPPPGAAPSPETQGTGPGRKAVKVCWVDKRKKMQLGLILPSAASWRGAARAGLPMGSL